MHGPLPTDFLSILNGCRNGKRAYQKMLYTQYYGYAMSVCMRYTLVRDEAVIVMNDAFLKVFQNLDKFDELKPFKPWFRKILVNTAINHLRKNDMMRLHESIEDHTQREDNSDLISDISYEEIIKLLGKLSPAYRTVFNLYAIEGYKHEEIGELLGISTGTSKSNYAKARKRLQNLLNAYFETDYA